MATELENLPQITDDVIVFTKKMCVQCDATKRALKKRGDLQWTDRDIMAYPALVDELVSKGMLQMPLVVTKNGEFWQGFRPDMIKAI